MTEIIGLVDKDTKAAIDYIPYAQEAKGKIELTKQNIGKVF